MKLVIFFGVIAIVLLYFVTLYNALVNLKHAVARSWANIDVLLKQRHDELPKLVEVCKQYAQFEQQTLSRVMEARSAVAQYAQSRNMEGLGHEEDKLRGLIGQVLAVAEAYPELRPTSNSLIWPSASASWKTPSPTDASCITTRSTSTMCASSNFPMC